MEEFEMELTIKVKVVFEAFKAVRQTWHEPGEPANIAVCDVILPSGDVIADTHKGEIEEGCWDHLIECEAENAMMQAEHRYDSMMDR